MNPAALPLPGVVHGAYPQRLAAPRRRLPLPLGPGLARYRRFVARVRAAGECAAPDAAAAGARLAREGLCDDALVDAFRAIDAAFAAALGVRLHDTQMLAARIMLDGRLAEMATGEGKTYATAVGAAAAALAGIPVHVVTANEYLVKRDAAMLRPVYGALGISTGAIEAAMDPPARRAQYACDIAYCTASELAFDYLRDGIAKGGARSDLEAQAARLAGAGNDAPVLRGLCMALVDEADSCLIDDARVPLILARAAPNAARDAYYAHALDLARQLTAPRDFRLAPAALRSELTAAGRAVLEERASALPPVWRNRRHREEAVETALAALHLYRADTHYIVRDGKVALIDAATGRVAEGRAWSGGLHQMIELKEGCEPTAENRTCAQITFQRLFRRYWRLGGMSGTLAEARGELRAIYGLEVLRVPLNSPSRRRVLPTRIFADRERQFAAVLARARELAAAGRPLLIGTDSVAASHELSARLAAVGLAHQVLNARHEADEAAIVAAAGAPGRITVATNMAGRGTDIALGAGVAQLGGLYLICCQHNASSRIDRQLIGRAARRGDPGCAETLLSANQPLIAPLFPRWLARSLPENGLHSPAWAVRLAVRLPQWLQERRDRAERRTMLEADQAWDRRHPAGAAAE